MRLILIIQIAFLGYGTVTASVLEEVRNSFPYFSNEQKIDELLEGLKHEHSALASAYKGALYMFKAKFSNFPTSQYTNFKKGKNLIDNAIKSDSNNIEIRFIRLMFQYQLPTFLGYRNNRETDFNFFISNYKNSSILLKRKEKMRQQILQIDKLESEKKKILIEMI